eukprot:COSAG02_NODE_9055_length_2346_cov_12.600356_1_plen_83_part_10
MTPYARGARLRNPQKMITLLALPSLLLLTADPYSSPSLSDRFGDQCASAVDCALNGDCVAGRCVCRPPWTGDALCHTFRFLPS